MYNIKDSSVEKIESTTFSALNMLESDIEEILINNIDMICEEDESLLIVGRQVVNLAKGISDLTAVDHNGNIVLIEIKRDVKDIQARKEAFEFQAIRYAASYGTISDSEQLINEIYAPYLVNNHREEVTKGPYTSFELATRKLNEFLTEHGAIESFNKKQRIILVASGFDDQTMSAVAWLVNNGVNISCFKMIPYKIKDEIYIKIEKLLPLTEYEEYYVGFSTTTNRRTTPQSKIKRNKLPRILDMLEWGVIQAGDIIIAKYRTDEATLLDNGNVKVIGEEMSLQKWLRGVYGWSSVQTYAFALHKVKNKTLSRILGKSI